MHEQWIEKESVDSWALLIDNHYLLTPNVIFNGSDLMEALGQTPWFENSIACGGVVKVKEDVTLDQNSFQPKGVKKPIRKADWCYAR